LRKNRRIFDSENQLWNAIQVEWNRLDSVEILQNLALFTPDRYREVIEKTVVQLVIKLFIDSDY
jgi:hypothetical protein